MRLCDVGAAIQEVMESYEVEINGKVHQGNFPCDVIIFYTRNKVQGMQLFEKVQPSPATHVVNKNIGNI